MGRRVFVLADKGYVSLYGREPCCCGRGRQFLEER